MNGPDRRQLGEYVRHVANLMGLRDWTIDLMNDPPDDADAVAEITCTYGRKHAQLRVCGHWDRLSRDEKRRTIVHELIHPHFEPAVGMVRLDLTRTVGQSVYDVLWKGFIRQMEYGVDGLCDAIAPLMPAYPETIKPKRRK